MLLSANVSKGHDFHKSPSMFTVVFITYHVQQTVKHFVISWEPRLWERTTNLITSYTELPITINMQNLKWLDPAESFNKHQLHLLDPCHSKFWVQGKCHIPSLQQSIIIIIMSGWKYIYSAILYSVYVYSFSTGQNLYNKNSCFLTLCHNATFRNMYIQNELNYCPFMHIQRKTKINTTAIINN